MNTRAMRYALAALCAASGCGGDKSEMAAGSTSASAAIVGTGTSAVPQATGTTGPAVPIDPELADIVKKTVAACKVEVAEGYYYSCSGSEQTLVNEYARTKKPKDFANWLTELAVGSDPNVATVALGALVNGWSSLEEAVVKSNATPQAFNRLLTLLAQHEKGAAVRIAPITTYVATILRQADKLWPVVDAHKNAAVAPAAYRAAMTHGRLDVLPKLKDVAAKGNVAHTTAALYAPRGMATPTDAEKAAYCPWAQGFLGHDDPKVVVEAGHTAVSCEGAYVDAVLDEMEKRQREKKFDHEYTFVLREICFEFMKGVSGASGKEAQCSRNYAFLEKLGNDPSLDGKTRGMALWDIYYQRRDGETLKLLRRYENDKNEEVRKRVGEAIKSLVEHYKVK